MNSACADDVFECKITDGSLWHLASIRARALNGRYRRHSGHCLALARDPSVANQVRFQIAGKCSRPTAVLFDHAVNLLHQANGFGERGRDLLVVGNIAFCECAASAVFEPFFTDFIATDVEVPHRF